MANAVIVCSLPLAKNAMHSPTSVYTHAIAQTYEECVQRLRGAAECFIRPRDAFRVRYIWWCTSRMCENTERLKHKAEIWRFNQQQTQAQEQAPPYRAVLANLMPGPNLASIGQTHAQDQAPLYGVVPVKRGQCWSHPQHPCPGPSSN